MVIDRANINVFVMGEAMVELAPSSVHTMSVGFGGDTYNTSVYLARLGWRPHFVTALGTDLYSQRLRAVMRAEGIMVEHVLTNPEKLPGLYTIELDEHGERSFHYWRSDSAARTFFDLPDSEAAMDAMARADCLVLSGITLAIFSDAECARLFEVAKSVKSRGGHVVFDPNYRPKLWTDPKDAIAAYKKLAPHTTIVLTTEGDEAALHGDQSLEDIAGFWAGDMPTLLVLKKGGEGAMVIEPSAKPILVPAIKDHDPLDTTGAGDSFNAAFLAAYLGGATPCDAAAQGNDLAAQVIRTHGAIAPRDRAGATAYKGPATSRRV